MSNAVSEVTEVGYDHTPQGQGGLYLRLKEKGQKVKLRLVGNPISYKKTFTDSETGETNTKVVFAWCVIDRTSQEAAVRVFEGGTQIFLGVKQYANDTAEWGDPTGYDLIFERTEAKGSYYTVKPSSRGQGPLSEEDLALLKTAGVDPKAPALWTRLKVDDSGEGQPAATAPASSDDYDPFS